MGPVARVYFLITALSQHSMKRAAYLLLFLFTTTAYCQIKFPLNSASARLLADSLAAQINRFYIDGESAVKMSTFIKKRAKEGAYNNIKNPHLLAAMLTSDVYSAHADEHFHVEFNPAISDEISGNIEDVPGMVAEKLKMDMSRNFGFRKAEIINGNIGYLEISSFSRLNQYSRAAADAALRMISNSRAIIIDLRYGVGGSPDMVTHLLSRFFSDKQHVTDIYIRSEKVTLPYYTRPDTTFSALSKVPVYILTSYKTFSAAEGFTWFMKTRKRAVVVGERTRGGAHTVAYRPIGFGFIADIPFGRALDPISKNNWEGTGIEPDIRVAATDALETASYQILEAALSATSDTLEQRRLIWHQRLLWSHNNPVRTDTNTLKRFTGDFGAYTITYTDGCLYYQKIGKAKFPLVPVTESCMRPKGNDSFLVEFVESGTKVKMLTTYEDGRREVAERIK